MSIDATDAKLVQALNALVSKDSGAAKTLPGIPAAAAINPSVGIGTNPVAGGAGGVAGSGLVLTDPITIVSSDGVFSLTFTHTASFVAGATTYKLGVVG